MPNIANRAAIRLGHERRSVAVASRREVPPSWVATRSPCVPTRLPLLGVLRDTHRGDLRRSICAQQQWPHRGCVGGSSGWNQPMKPRKRKEHNAQLTAIPDRPFAWATSPTHEPLPRTRPGPLPTTLWLSTRCLRRGPHNKLPTNSGASFSWCGSPEGWRSANSICQAHWRSGTERMASHRVRSLEILSSILSAMYSSLPIGVPNTVIPSGCHASAPTFRMSLGTTPALFHARVLPWCNRMPAILIIASSRTLYRGSTRAGSHSKYTSSKNAQSCSPSSR